MELIIDAKIEKLDDVLEFVDGFLEENGKAKIEIRDVDGSAEITFTDSGTPYNPLARPDPDITLSAEERKIGGLGIYIVKKSMDNVNYEYRNGKNVFTIRKRMKA